MSGGRVKIETLAAGAVVPAFEVFDAVSRGVLHVGASPFGYILGKSLAGIPLSHGPVFGMDGMDYWGWYYDGGGMALLEEFYRDVLKMNLVGFPVPTDYPQGLGWFKEPIESLDDLQGMKYRIYGIGAETYGRLGVSVVTLPGGEIVPAMERGVIEGAEWINCVEDQKLGLNNVAKHYYTPGMHEPVTGGQIVVNGDVWNDLPPDLQEIMRIASVNATVQRNFILNRETAEACQELIADGVTLHRTPDDILIELPPGVGEDPGRVRGRRPLLRQGHREPEEVRRGHRAVQDVLVPALRLRGQVLLEGQDLPEHRGGPISLQRAYPEPEPGFGYAAARRCDHRDRRGPGLRWHSRRCAEGWPDHAPTKLEGVPAWLMRPDPRRARRRLRSSPSSAPSTRSRSGAACCSAGWRCRWCSA